MPSMVSLNVGVGYPQDDVIDDQHSEAKLAVQCFVPVLGPDACLARASAHCSLGAQIDDGT